MINFFVSYTQTDRGWAEWIAQQLSEAGYTVKLQAWDMPAGTNFVLQMQRATTEAERTIAVLSSDYLTSAYAAAEWAAAFAKDPSGEKGILVPVRVRKSEPGGLLAALHYIDLVDIHEEHTAKEMLINGVRGASPTPSPPSPFPGSPKIPLRHTPTDQSRFPGKLPTTWNIPYPPNPHFTGRQALLSEVRTALTCNRPTAIYGLGGVGKTQIALEYAYRYSTDYDLIWWIRAKTTDTLTADTAALADALGLPAKAFRELAVLATDALRELTKRDRWLLVFNDAPDAAHLARYLPTSLNGHVLITSRDRNFGTAAHPIPIPTFARAEAVEFVLKRAGQWNKASPTEKTAARKLADKLGDLPLALEHAGAYAHASARSLAQYFELFCDRQNDPRAQEELKALLRNPNLPTGLSESNLEDLWTTWELNFLEVHNTFPAATELLNLCAFMAPEGIPLTMLWEHARLLPSELLEVVRSSVSLDRALAALLRYSLIDVDRGSRNAAMHPLVQLVTRNRLSRERQAFFASIAVRIVNAAFPFLKYSEDFQIWPKCARLLPHAQTATGFTQHSVPQTREEASQFSQLLSKCGLYYFDRAEFDTAQRLLEQALHIDEIAFGSDHPTVARDLNHLGWVLKDLDNLNEARDYFERALRLNKSTLGPNNPTVATASNNLGWVLKDLDRLDEAKKCFEDALRIDEFNFGPDDSTVARDCTNLGCALEALRNVEDASAFFERALRINKATHGPTDPKVAKDLRHLGRVSQALGNLGGARSEFTEAFHINTEAFGPRHPTVATDLIHLGSVLRSQHDQAGAKGLFDLALQIDKNAFGLKHPAVARDRIHLGSAFMDLNDQVEAEKQFRQALQIDREKFGPQHPLVARDLIHLGWALKDGKNLTGAKEQFEKALKIVGPKSPTRGTVLNYLGWVLKDLGELKGARERFEDALSADEVNFGREDLAVAKDCLHLGWAWKELGDRSRAQTYFERAIRIASTQINRTGPADSIMKEARRALDDLR